MIEQSDLPERIRALVAYSPGLSMEEIRQKYGLANIIKMASNENPLGCPPLAREAIVRHASSAFRYPRGGNPRLAQALAKKHGVNPDQIAIGNGSDEIIDLLIRILCEPGKRSIVCFQPCFAIYPVQAQINGIETRRVPVNEDFSFNFERLLNAVDYATRICFLTTPDNPSGYCPPKKMVRDFARELYARNAKCILVIDEAYMDFAPEEKESSLLASGEILPNTVFLRTFSKSYGLAGLRAGYGILPEELASFFWRARLPFSLNILAEEACLAALEDAAFRETTLKTVKKGRETLASGLIELGCRVFPSSANFLMFAPPANSISAGELFEKLLQKGIIIRRLTSYGLPDLLRVSVGNSRENRVFLSVMEELL